MKYCSSCGAGLKDDAIYCSNCGNKSVSQTPDAPVQKKTFSKIGLGCLIAIAAILILFVIVYFGGCPSSNPPTRSTNSTESKDVTLLPERVVLDDKGNAACVDFRKLRSEGEKPFALNMINLGSNAAHSSNDELKKAGKVIALYIVCPDNPNASDCRDISKIEMMQALADIETVCASVR